MMGKRYLAITQLELNPDVDRRADTSRHFLRALLLDPSNGWHATRLDLRCPGSNEQGDTGQFIVSALATPDATGQPHLVYAITRAPSECYVITYRHDGVNWRSEPVAADLPSVDLIRTVAIGDVDGDGVDEIVLGTRPNGAVLVLDSQAAGYVVTMIDRDQYGAGTTNTREVAVADIDGDGALEILVATARADAPKWQATPGAIFLYRRSADRWERVVIDDHAGRTHSRMVAIADVKNDGVAYIVSSAVGVISPDAVSIDLEPELRIHRWTGNGATSEPIGTLEKMIKSRSFAAGDIDDSGEMALVVGTRALGVPGFDTTCLYIYRFDAGTQAWHRETLDTSGPFGFHCVAIVDADGDGQREIIASDDGKGLIKLYRKRAGNWEHEIIYAADHEIFCSAIHLIETVPVTS